MATRDQGHPISPYGVTIDLALDAQGIIQRMSEKEAERTAEWYERRRLEIEKRRYEDTEAEMRRHRTALDKIRRRYEQDMDEASATRAEFVANTESMTAAMLAIARQAAAQLSVVGYPRQATPELAAIALGV